MRVAPPYLTHMSLQPGSRRYQYPCQHQHHSNQTKMRMVASTRHESRGARRAENGHVWINLQRQISGGIKASCIHTYLAPPLLPRGADTCHACNKWSNQPRGATMATAIGEGEADNTALPLRQILLTAWTWLPLLPISLDTRTDRGNLTKRPPRLPAILAHTIL